MNKFFHKTLQHSVGITGLAIVYMGISLVPDFLYNLWTFALSHPISGGLATGLPLIPLLMSSKQKRMYELTDQVTHSDFAATTEVISQSIDHTLAGWVQKVDFYFSYDTPFNNNVVFGGYSYIETQNNSIGNPNEEVLDLGDILDSFGGSTEFVINRTYNRPFVEVYQSSQTGDTISKHSITMMEWVDVLDRQFVKVEASDIATAPTGGVVDIRIVVTLIVAAFGVGKSRKRSSAPNYMLIYGTIAGSAGLVQRSYVPETDLRLYATSATYWGLTLDDESYMHLGRSHLDVGDMINTAATFSEVVRHHKNGLFVGNITQHKSDTTTSSQDQFYGLHSFKKSPIFMKKSEPWLFSVNNESGNDNWFYLATQVMPDYQNAVDWNVDINVDETTDSWQYFTIPYDLYVTRVVWDFKFTILSTETGNTDTPIEIMALKPGDEFITSAHGTGFLEYPEGSTATTSLRHGGIQEKIFITAPPADVYGGGTGKTSSYTREGVTEVNDYYPRGSKIGINTPALSTMSDPGFSMQIEGVVAMKTGAKDALGYYLVNEEILDVVTLVGAGQK